jgi:proteasome lid subunit RPN8/RPN11
VEPLWHERLGEPYVSRLRVALRANGEAAPGVVQLPISYLEAHAARAAHVLAEKKVRAAADPYLYLLSAERREAPPAAAPATPGARWTPLDLPSVSLAELASAALPIGEQHAQDFRVFVPQHILEDAATMAERAGQNETGSLLLGRLQRDANSSDVFVELTAQVPASETSATHTKLTFTARTWAAARAALALRKQGELMVGWFHTHPQVHWKLKCSTDCPPERRATCPLSGGSFFSEDDVLLHRSIFPRAFCVALLVTVTADGLRYAMFGWRDAELVQRGFDLLPGRDPSRFLPLSQTNATIGKAFDEKSCQH